MGRTHFFVYYCSSNGKRKQHSTLRVLSGRFVHRWLVCDDDVSAILNQHQALRMVYERSTSTTEVFLRCFFLISRAQYFVLQKVRVSPSSITALPSQTLYPSFALCTPPSSCLLSLSIYTVLRARKKKKNTATTTTSGLSSCMVVAVIMYHQLYGHMCLLLHLRHQSTASPIPSPSTATPEEAAIPPRRTSRVVSPAFPLPARPTRRIAIGKFRVGGI